jgi:uncharacterized protein YecT (DUF1311 family)
MCALSVYGAEDIDVIQCNYEGTQQELNVCAINDYKAEDKLLNEKYKKTMQTLPKKQQNQLRQEQRLWLKQRDPKCRQEAKESEGGSIWPLVFYSCLTTSTKLRTEALGK